MPSSAVATDEDVSSAANGLRKIAFLSSGVALLICVAIAILLGISTSVLIGDVTGFQIAYFAGVIGLLALGMFVMSAPAPRWWLYVAVPITGVAAAVAILLTVIGVQFVADTKVTPIVAEGCPTGYIAMESSGGGGSIIGVRDGWSVLEVQRFSGDDFNRPFAAGDYVARSTGDEIAVWHDGAATDPAFTLPQLPSHTCD